MCSECFSYGYGFSCLNRWNKPPHHSPAKKNENCKKNLELWGEVNSKSFLQSLVRNWKKATKVKYRSGKGRFKYAIIFFLFGCLFVLDCEPFHHVEQEQCKHRILDENRLELHTDSKKKCTRNRKNIGFNKSSNDPFLAKQLPFSFHFAPSNTHTHTHWLRCACRMSEREKENRQRMNSEPISCLMRMTPFPLTHV